MFNMLLAVGDAADVSLASLSTIIEGILSAMTFIWSIFTNLCQTIATNSLLLYSVLASLAFGVLGIGYKVVKGFGLRGRR